MRDAQMNFYKKSNFYYPKMSLNYLKIELSKNKKEEEELEINSIPDILNDEDDTDAERKENEVNNEDLNQRIDKINSCLKETKEENDLLKKESHFPYKMRYDILYILTHYYILNILLCILNTWFCLHLDRIL